jgi:propionate catabolism operon transcriptional regulator
MQEEMVKKVAGEFKHKVEVIIKLGVLEGAISRAKELEEQGAEVVVGWGGTIALLEKNLSVPIVSIRIPDFDVMRAVKHACKFGSKIALMMHEPVAGIGLLEELYDVSIRQVLFNNQNDFNYGMIEAFNEGCDVVIGKSYVTLNMAKEYGKKAVLITYNIESIREVFREAIRIATLRRKEREEYTRLETIFNSLIEGVIVTDNLGKITLFNRAAEKILGFRSHSVVGQDVATVLPQIKISKFLKGSMSPEDELYTVGDIGIIATHKPIFLDEGVLGVVSTFREASEIQKIDSKIRKKLVSKGFLTHYGIDYFSSRSPAMKKIIEKVKKFSVTDSTFSSQGRVEQ